MPQYYLPRFFVPDDKDIADMLYACGTSPEKMWEIAASYRILCSKEDRRHIFQDYISRLPTDHPKLVMLYELNSTKDRDENYSQRVIKADVSLEKMKALVNEVRTSRNDDTTKEKFEIKQTGSNEFEVKVEYQDPDFSKTQAIQVRERELKLVVEKTDGKLSIRHHDNSRATDIAIEIEKRIDALLGTPPPKAIFDFSGIRDAKKRTRFFTELITKIPNSTLRDVSNLKVYRLKADKKNTPENEEDEAEETHKVEGDVRRIVLSGANLILSEEYQQFEARGFFIGSIDWISEIGDDDKPRYHLTASFNNPDKPTNLSYGVCGKYDSIEGKGYRTYTTKPSVIEKNAMLHTLEEAAGAIYDGLLVEENQHGSTNSLPPK